MTKWLCNIGLALAVGLGGACGADEHDERTDPTCVGPEATGCHIAVDDHSFVRWTGLVTDGNSGGISTAVVEHSPGKFCMSGTVDGGPNGSGWGAILLVGLFQGNGPGVLTAPLDASALGIAKVRFSVENAPPTGVLPQITQIQTADCKQVPGCLESFDGTTPVIDPGTVTMALTDFVNADADHPGAKLDPTLVTGLQFYVGPLPGMAFHYGFCVRDLAFLDAGGHEIKP